MALPHVSVALTPSFLSYKLPQSSSLELFFYIQKASKQSSQPTSTVNSNSIYASTTNPNVSTTSSNKMSASTPPPPPPGGNNGPRLAKLDPSSRPVPMTAETAEPWRQPPGLSAATRMSFSTLLSKAVLSFDATYKTPGNSRVTVTLSATGTRRKKVTFKYNGPGRPQFEAFAMQYWEIQQEEQAAVARHDRLTGEEVLAEGEYNFRVKEVE
jgi:hypothetical protein